MLWLGINTGPGNIDLDLIKGSGTGFLNGVRGAFPLVVLALWPIDLLLTRRGAIRSGTLPERLWIFYGLVCIVASVYVKPWFDFGYWSLAWFAAFSATDIYMRRGRDPLERAIALNRLNWLLCSVVLVTVVWIGRGALLADTSMGLSGYGVTSRLPTVGGMPMVRATGISRLAAVPAMVAFPYFWYARGLRRLVWAAVFAPSAYLVWVMQARGSLASFAFALGFMMILLGGVARRSGIVLAILLVTICVLGVVPKGTVDYLYLYATRGAQGEQLESMSGRTQIFTEAWQLIKEAPVIGYGPQADRRVVGNAQNGVLYALLCAGFLGGFGYIAGLLVSWLILFRIARVRDALAPIERIVFVQVAGMMAFFTMRSYPENGAALFSVDLLVQLPALVYLGELDRAIKLTRAVRRARSLTVSEPEAGRALHAYQL
jgi:O-antigen ligase